MALTAAIHFRPFYRREGDRLRILLAARKWRGAALAHTAIFFGVTKRARIKDDRDSASSADVLLEELVKFLARRAAERDDEKSRSNPDRTVRHNGGKRDSR